jgi:hypothetical protein
MAMVFIEMVDAIINVSALPYEGSIRKQIKRNRSARGNENMLNKMGNTFFIIRPPY